MEARKQSLFSDQGESKPIGRINVIPIHQSCYKTARDSKASGSILFESKDGNIITALEYMNLFNKHYDREIGILLFYTHATITIYGKQLDSLFRDLNKRLVSSINEYDMTVANDAEVDEKQAIVERIEIRYKDENIDKEIKELKESGFTQYSPSPDG